jgi:RNA polymerase sigma factor (sigma-70 family)
MTVSLPDEEVMLMVRDGSVQMLEVLFDRYQKPLFNFYAGLTKDRPASEDLVQEVFVRILKYRATYKPGTKFRPWIYQIARNARTDQMKKYIPNAEPAEESEPMQPPANSLENDQQHALLRRALDKLPEEKREILLLSRFQGLRYEEIAQLLGLQVGAVKVRVHRALQELRQVFEGLERGGVAPRSTAAGANYEM